MYLLEKGTFQVTSDYPSGAYLVPSVSGDGLMVSSFQSIPLAIYYTIVTQTTLGYGDLYPTTVGGRAVACMLALFGILVLSMPVSILRTYFDAEYAAYEQKLLKNSWPSMSDAGGLVRYNDLLVDEIKDGNGTAPTTNLLPALTGSPTEPDKKPDPKSTTPKRNRGSIQKEREASSSFDSELKYTIAKCRVELARHEEGPGFIAALAKEVVREHEQKQQQQQQHKFVQGLPRQMANGFKVFVYVCVYRHVCMRACVRACVCVCVLCVCIFIYYARDFFPHATVL
jgi:hypothetical protein